MPPYSGSHSVRSSVWSSNALSSWRKQPSVYQKINCFLSRINSLSIFQFEAGCCGKKMLLFKLNNGPNCIVHRAGIVFCAEVVNTGQIMWSKMLNRIQALQAAISSHNASVTIKKQLHEWNGYTLQVGLLLSTLELL